MIRGLKANGDLVIGLTRSSIEALLAGHSVTSPAYDGHGPEVVLVFAEDDKALREQWVAEGRMRPTTVEKDMRRS